MRRLEMKTRSENFLPANLFFCYFYIIIVAHVTADDVISSCTSLTNSILIMALFRIPVHFFPSFYFFSCTYVHRMHIKWMELLEWAEQKQTNDIMLDVSEFRSYNWQEGKLQVCNMKIVENDVKDRWKGWMVRMIRWCGG